MKYASEATFNVVPPLFILESHVSFCPDLVIVFVKRKTVVNVVNLQLKHEVLVNLDVWRNAVDCLCRSPVCLVAVSVILYVCLEPRSARDAYCGIPRVSLACARECFAAAVVVADLVTCGVSIFCAYSPIVLVILGREHVAVSAYGDTIACEVACPAEEADEEPLDWLHLQRANDVLLLVGVGCVHALTVGNHKLIVEEAMLVAACWEEIALHLYALVATASA